MNYAQVDNGQVINIIVVDDDSPLINELNLIKADESVCIGWHLIDGVFVAPEPEPTPESSPQELLQQLEQQKQALVSVAEKCIFDLTEATDSDLWEPDEINTDDVKALKLWRKYLVLLKKLDVTTDNIEWPKAPD